MSESAKTPLSECNLAFTDVETTELDPTKGEIIQLAVVVMSPDWQEVSRKQWFMHPRWPGVAHPKALEVNGYDRVSWERYGVTTHDKALGEYVALTAGCVLAAHNVSFDWSFIEAELRRQGLAWLGDYHKIDTVSLFWPEYLRLNGEMKGLSLKAVCEYYGISNDGSHDAMIDVDRMIQAYARRMGLPSPGDLHVPA